LIALAILAGFLTMGFALVIAHKKMSMEVSRVSEIEAVANLVGGFIRQDRRLLDCKDEEEVSSRLNELIDILNDDYISNSGFAGTEVSTITGAPLIEDDEIYTISFKLADNLARREEAYHVVVSIR
jgi:hypothetical protein